MGRGEGYREKTFKTLKQILLDRQIRRLGDLFKTNIDIAEAFAAAVDLQANLIGRLLGAHLRSQALDLAHLLLQVNAAPPTIRFLAHGIKL